jgi:hypothetical protein
MLRHTPNAHNAAYLRAKTERMGHGVAQLRGTVDSSRKTA